MRIISFGVYTSDEAPITKRMLEFRVQGGLEFRI